MCGRTALVAHLQMKHEEEQGHNDSHDDLLEGSSAHKRGETHEKKLACHVEQVEEEVLGCERCMQEGNGACVR